MGPSTLVSHTLRFCHNIWVSTVFSGAQVVQWAQETPFGWGNMPDKFPCMHEGDQEGRLVQMVWVVVWNAEDRGSLFIKVTLLRTQWLLMQRSRGDRHTYPRREDRGRVWTESKREGKQWANGKGARGLECAGFNDCESRLPERRSLQLNYRRNTSLAKTQCSTVGRTHKLWISTNVPLDSAIHWLLDMAQQELTGVLVCSSHFSF